MQDSRSHILHLIEDDDLEGVKLIESLKEYPLLRECYARPLGGRDNHTLEEHTLKAILCFESTFQGREELIFKPRHFKLLLALHDLGKPQAMLEGDPDKQHEYTLKIINEIAEDIRVSKGLWHQIIAVIDADSIGKYLNNKHNLPIEDSLKEIEKMAADLSVPVAILWPTLLTYYQCDAAGYESLRRKVFVTDEAGNAIYFKEVHGFRLKDESEAQRFDILRQRVKEFGKE
ncbi:MAG TPA: hypothetical protein VJ836_02605 [Candidatus Saccharimonadales bacterium]|nr:hypothetical protein [Candidatus Saccharimonadales bacterium]